MQKPPFDAPELPTFLIDVKHVEAIATMISLQGTNKYWRAKAMNRGSTWRRRNTGEAELEWAGPRRLKAEEVES